MPPEKFNENLEKFVDKDDNSVLSSNANFKHNASNKKRNKINQNMDGMIREDSQENSLDKNLKTFKIETIDGDLFKNLKNDEKSKDQHKYNFLKSYNDFKKVRQDLNAFNPELNKVDYTLKSLDILDKRIKRLDNQQENIVKLLGEISTKFG